MFNSLIGRLRSNAVSSASASASSSADQVPDAADSDSDLDQQQHQQRSKRQRTDCKSIESAAASAPVPAVDELIEEDSIITAANIKSQLRHGDIVKFHRDIDNEYYSIRYYHWGIIKIDPIDQQQQIYVIHLWDPHTEIGNSFINLNNTDSIISNSNKLISAGIAKIKSKLSVIPSDIQNYIKSVIKQKVKGLVQIPILDILLSKQSVLIAEPAVESISTAVVLAAAAPAAGIVAAPAVIEPQVYCTLFDTVHSGSKVTIDRRTILTIDNRRIESYNPIETVIRAESQLGMIGYNLFTRNCEHFVNWAKFGTKHSTQINQSIETVITTTGLILGLINGIATSSTGLAMIKSLLTTVVNSKLAGSSVSAIMQLISNINSDPNHF